MKLPSLKDSIGFFLLLEGKQGFYTRKISRFIAAGFAVKIFY